LGEEKTEEYRNAKMETDENGVPMEKQILGFAAGFVRDCFKERFMLVGFGVRPRVKVARLGVVFYDRPLRLGGNGGYGEGTRTRAGRYATNVPTNCSIGWPNPIIPDVRNYNHLSEAK
jgi:hypothetical protein